MTDARILWNPADLVGDFVLHGTMLDTSHELVTSMAVALFSDATAAVDDRLPDEALRGQPGSRRGVWMDHEAAEIHNAGPIGSRLWLIERDKHSEDTRRRAELYAREALRYLTENGIAAAVDVEGVWVRRGLLGLDITVTRGDRSRIAVRFAPLWEEIEGAA